MSEGLDRKAARRHFQIIPRSFSAGMIGEMSVLPGDFRFFTTIMYIGGGKTEKRKNMQRSREINGLNGVKKPPFFPPAAEGRPPGWVLPQRHFRLPVRMASGGIAEFARVTAKFLECGELDR